MLVLLKLLVTDGNDLGVESHLVHVLHIVMLLIKLHLSLGKQTFGTLILLDFDLGSRQFVRTAAVHRLHLGLASLGSSLLLRLLLFVDTFLRSGVLLTGHLSSLPHASDVRSGEDSSLTNFFALTHCLVNVTPHLAQFVVADDCHVRVSRHRCGG